VKSAPRRLHTLALTELADENPEAVMIDFMQPTGAGGRMVGEGRLARANETDRRSSQPTGRRGAPRRAGERRAFHQADGQ
jgi:hypothetical protein